MCFFGTLGVPQADPSLSIFKTSLYRAMLRLPIVAIPQSGVYDQAI
jgi:hypothetical protein